MTINFSKIAQTWPIQQMQKSLSAFTTNFLEILSKSKGMVQFIYSYSCNTSDNINWNRIITLLYSHLFISIFYCRLFQRHYQLYESYSVSNYWFITPLWTEHIVSITGLTIVSVVLNTHQCSGAREISPRHRRITSSFVFCSLHWKQCAIARKRMSVFKGPGYANSFSELKKFLSNGW